MTEYNWIIFSEGDHLVITRNGTEFIRLIKSVDNYAVNRNKAIHSVIKIGGDIDDQANVLQYYDPTEFMEQG